MKNGLKILFTGVLMLSSLVAQAATEPVGKTTLKLSEEEGVEDVRSLRKDMAAIETEILTVSRQISAARTKAESYRTLGTAAKNNLIAAAEAEVLVLESRRQELSQQRSLIQEKLAN